MKFSIIPGATLALCLMSFSLPAAAGPGARPSAEGRAPVFAALDKDGDGSVSRAEAEASVQAMFSEADGDADGFVTQDEMRAFNQARRAAAAERMRERRGAAAQKRWQKVDADGNDRLDMDEFLSARMEWFSAADADGDGVITSDEHTAMREAGEERRGRWRDRGDRRAD